jgi:hypothetical protein
MPLQYDYRLIDWSKECASWCWENHKDSYISYTVDINITIFTFKIFLVSEGKQLLWHVVCFVRWAYIYTFRSLSLMRILILCVLYIVYLMTLDQLSNYLVIRVADYVQWTWKVFGRDCDLFQLITINLAGGTKENHMNHQINWIQVWSFCSLCDLAPCNVMEKKSLPI